MMFIALLLVHLLLELLEQLAFGLAHPAPLEQLGPAKPGAAERLLQPPALDLRVVPREQHRRRRFPLVHFRPRVLRGLQQPAHERVLLGREPVPERAGQLPYHRVDQHHRRELAARENVVADRQLLVHRATDQALVHAFVTPAQQYQPFFPGERRHLGVIEHRALRRKIDYSRATLRRGLRRGDRLFQRLGEHHHAGPASVRPVIDRAVVVRREIPWIPQREAPKPLLQRPPRDAPVGDGGERLGEERHAIEADHQSAPQSTSTVPASRSTLRITSAVAGTSRSPDSCSTRITSFAPPALKNPVTLPSRSPCPFTTAGTIKSTWQNSC